VVVHSYAVDSISMVDSRLNTRRDRSDEFRHAQFVTRFGTCTSGLAESN